jgi:hypothetical protein
MIGCTWECLGRVLKVVTTMIISVPEHVKVLTEEHEDFLDRIRKAEDRVAATKERGRRDIMKKKADQLRIIGYRIEDVIDEWKSCLQHEKYDCHFFYIISFSLFFAHT